MRIPTAGWCTAVFLLATTPPVSAQRHINLNFGGSYAEALGGQFGVEARLGYYPLEKPADFFIGGDYFFADCREGCSLWGWRLGAHLHPAKWTSYPFLSGSLGGREWKRGEKRFSPEGFSLGAGYRKIVGKLRIQIEVSREFLGEELDQWVFRIGTG
jgi:hypothetical protein